MNGLDALSDMLSIGYSQSRVYNRHGRLVAVNGQPVKRQPSGRVRDSQRSKLYKAEAALGYGKPLPTVEDIERYLNKLTSSAWWKVQKWDNRTSEISVKDGRGCRSATGSPFLRSITMPRWSRYEVIVLHEVAHVVTRRSAAAHGWEFAANYLKLVRHCLGVEAERTLKESFRKHKVRYLAPRAKREMTPEAREAMLVRLADMRAKAGIAKAAKAAT